MKVLTLETVALLIASAACQSSCPSLPGDIKMGTPVPINPADIPAGCSDLEILVARGTSEPNAEGGKFGIVVGDPIVTNTTLVLPGARGYPYPASYDLTGVRTGATDVNNRLKAQSKACPDQKFALVGYSQGAALMHAAAKDIPRDLYPKIVALVMTGDPAHKSSSTSTFPAGLAEKELNLCAEGDPVRLMSREGGGLC
ncbi:alpha/beta-hydrolase [Eremomyces bilateralis CBS 781.70]|uniref:Alpha/beta-hydrolase n=1 Tax=Eremomyces bilateralis CBS 781.70 TaxID=1392243 RepID=A0A6G1GEP3_9PEZI|nr:alpha/beta-hydrolase [Eremomyces bilateralis CBS 781.70]KAF1816528.1 alpha/beta-hydrolase [Eremomyces bilateralis CBS 781.70]